MSIKWPGKHFEPEGGRERRLNTPGSATAGCKVFAGCPAAAAWVGGPSACSAGAVVGLEGTGKDGAGSHAGEQAGSETETRSGGSGVDSLLQLAAVSSATELALTLVAGSLTCLACWPSTDPAHPCNMCLLSWAHGIDSQQVHQAMQRACILS